MPSATRKPLFHPVCGRGPGPIKILLSAFRETWAILLQILRSFLDEPWCCRGNGINEKELNLEDHGSLGKASFSCATSFLRFHVLKNISPSLSLLFLSFQLIVCLFVCVVFCA